jgi:hypothetical protein
VSNWIENYAADCRGPEEAAGRVLKEVTVRVIPRTKLHRVEITGSSPSAQTEELRLTFPSGAQFSGLSLVQLRELPGVSA